jgi:AcrR family transcriptional regulator
VASVNYYFNSKENLFLEIIRAGYKQCAQEFKILLQKNEGNLENTLVDFFRYFVEHSHDFRSHRKRGGSVLDTKDPLCSCESSKSYF